jgi:SAM-dependent methyltransferase
VGDETARHDTLLDSCHQELARVEAKADAVAEALAMAMTRQEEALQVSRDQTFARYVEANGLLRRDLGELALELNEFRSIYSMGMASVMPKMAALELAFDSKPGTKPNGSDPAPRPPAEANLDAFYLGLSEAFRGPEVMVRSRVGAYIPDLEETHHLGTVLDIGCGRGEMLEVLREANFDAYGIDLNRLCVDRCRQRGLTAELVGAREHLASIPHSSLGAITALHVVEHLELEDLIELIDLAMLALKPGGLLIFETPNPENVMVSSLYFYLDPSHLHPIPPLLLQFILASRGIVDLEVRRLQRDDSSVPGPVEGDPWFGDVKPIVDAFNARFACPPDYAILARRP